MRGIERVAVRRHLVKPAVVGCTVDGFEHDELRAVFVGDVDGEDFDVDLACLRFGRKGLLDA